MMSKAQASAAMRLHQRTGISLKSAWAKVKGKRSGGTMAKRKGGRKAKRSYRSYVRSAYHKAKQTRIPLTLTYLGTGAAVDVFNLAPTQRAALFNGVNQMLAQGGVNMKVNGYTIGAALTVLKGLCAFSPWLHAKVNAFLSGFYMKI
jgi:hypothetical protein